jgi:hypothetical protein
MISLPNIRMESVENIKLHPKIALGAISDCVGFFPPEVIAHWCYFGPVLVVLNMCNKEKKSNLETYVSESSPH